MYLDSDHATNADNLSMRAWQVLGNRALVRSWLANTNPLAEGNAPLHACEAPEIRRRLEQQLNWFDGAARRGRIG